MKPHLTISLTWTGEGIRVDTEAIDGLYAIEGVVQCVVDAVATAIARAAVAATKPSAAAGVVH